VSNPCVSSISHVHESGAQIFIHLAVTMSMQQFWPLSWRPNGDDHDRLLSRGPHRSGRAALFNRFARYPSIYALLSLRRLPVFRGASLCGLSVCAACSSAPPVCLRHLSDCAACPYTPCARLRCLHRLHRLPRSTIRGSEPVAIPQAFRVGLVEGDAVSQPGRHAQGSKAAQW
jgi:hypothetical protein